MPVSTTINPAGLPPVQALADLGVEWIGHVALPRGAVLPSCILRFCSASFVPSAFVEHGIDFPEAIQRSVHKRQAEYFYGRLAARLVLHKLGVGPEQIATGRHREPLWPDAIAGSITHNTTYAAAVAFRAPKGAGVGIDIETIATGETLAAIQGMALCAEELDRLGQLSVDIPLATLVTLAFSAKESFFKAAFNEVREYFDFDAVYVGAIDFEACCLTLHVRHRLADLLPAGATRNVFFRFLDSETVCTSCSWFYK